MNGKIFLMPKARINSKSLKGKSWSLGPHANAWGYGENEAKPTFRLAPRISVGEIIVDERRRCMEKALMYS